MDINKDKQQWNSLVAAAAGGSFLQSWEWGEIQNRAGTDFWRLAVEAGGEKTLALVVRRTMPGGRCWLYVPGGPATRNPNAKFQISNTWQKMQEELWGLAEREKAVFVRVEPRWDEGSVGMPMGNGWRKADHDVQPRHTLMVDLRLKEEELLAQMSQKTRYNINLARRKGVQIRFSKEPDGLEAFIDLSTEVEKRSGFHYQPPEYYRAMAKVLGSAGMFTMAEAVYEDKVLAAHLLISFGGTTTYAHGASSSRQRQLMAPYLLQWESIRRAKAAGERQYDFFGVAPQGKEENHSWSGITRFKLGFGGQRVNYVGAYDLVLEASWYWVYSVGRKILR